MNEQHGRKEQWFRLRKIDYILAGENMGSGQT